MASVHRGLDDHVEIVSLRSRDIPSPTASDHYGVHGDHKSRGTGILPMLPTAGSGTNDADNVFPRAVASSLVSLRSLYGPVTRRTRYFSPISRRRDSFSEPSNLEHPTSGNLDTKRRMSPVPHQRIAPGHNQHQLHLAHANHEHLFRQAASVNSSYGSGVQSRPSGVDSGARSRSNGTGSSDNEEDDEGRAQPVQDDTVLRQLHKNARKLRVRRTNLSEGIESLRIARYEAEARRNERNKAEMMFLEAAGVQFRDSSHLVELLDNMHRARDKHDEVNQRIDEVIEDLHQAELALDKQERVFFSSAVRSNAAYTESDSETDSSLPDRDLIPRPLSASLPYELLGISGLRPANIHPVLSQLQAAIRELGLKDEYLLNLQGRKQSLDTLRADLASVDVAELRQAVQDAVDASQLSSQTVTALETRFSNAISRDDADFLRSYSRDLSTSISERDAALQRIIHLNDECQRLGLVVSSDQLPPEWRTPQDDESFEDIQLSSTIQHTPKHPLFPLLLTNPATLLASEPTTPQTALTRALALPRANPQRQRLINQTIREVNIHNLLTGTDPAGRDGHPGPLIEGHLQALVRGQQTWQKGEWINRWLLHKLNLSPMEAENFYTVSQDHTDVSDRGYWQKCALRLWTQDKAADPARMASDPTTAGIRTEESLEYPEPAFERRRSDSDIYFNEAFQGEGYSK